MTEMSALAGKIEVRSLDAVVAEAAKNKDVAACRKLQVIASSLSIPKSTQTLEALVKVHASDTESLRSLIAEADAPLARPFAKAVFLDNNRHLFACMPGQLWFKGPLKQWPPETEYFSG